MFVDWAIFFGIALVQIAGFYLLYRGVTTPKRTEGEETGYLTTLLGFVLILPTIVACFLGLVHLTRILKL